MPFRPELMSIIYDFISRACNSFFSSFKILNHTFWLLLLEKKFVAQLVRGLGPIRGDLGSIPSSHIEFIFSCRRRTPMRGCGAADVSPFEQYTVTFKDWKALRTRLRSSNAAVSYGSVEFPWRSNCSDGCSCVKDWWRDPSGKGSTRTHRWSVLSAPELPKTAPTFSSSVSLHRWHGGQQLHDVWLHPQPTLSGDPSARGNVDMRRNGNLFSPRCGHFGFTGTTWSSKVVPLQSTQFSTTQGGLLFSGAEAVSTSRVLDLCNGLFVPCH